MFRALEITICSCLQSHQLVPGQHLEPQAQLGSGGKDPSGDPGVELETLWVSSAEGLAGSAGLRLRGFSRPVPAVAQGLATRTLLGHDVLRRSS